MYVACEQNSWADMILSGSILCLFCSPECKDQWQDRCDYQKRLQRFTHPKVQSVSVNFGECVLIERWPQTSWVLSYYLSNPWLSAPTLFTKPQRHTYPNFTLCLLACLLFSQNWPTVFMSLYFHRMRFKSSCKGYFSAIFRNFKSGYSKPLYTVTDL